MSFSYLAKYAEHLATAALTFCRREFGRNSVQIEKPINSTIMWRPTFLIKNGPLVLAFEYSDKLYPDTLKSLAAADFNVPVSIYQLAPLSSFQGDTKHTLTKLLRSRGFGLITIDEESLDVSVQFGAIPITQFISKHEYEIRTKDLANSVKTKLNRALTTYMSEPSQGLQQASQIVESLIRQLHAHAQAKSWLRTPANWPKTDAAVLNNQLLQCPQCVSALPQLGAARAFLQRFRNPSSHPPATAADARKRLEFCKEGFLEACRVTEELLKAGKILSAKLSVKNL